MQGFETAHVQVALNGDLGHTVPKRFVTAAEIAVLQMIHGKDAVIEIEPIKAESVKKDKEVKAFRSAAKRSMRVERARLEKLYSSDIKKAQKACPVEQIYPGAAARLFQQIDELDLAGVQFKPGMAPVGIDERDVRLTKATEAGMLLADGTVDDDAYEDAFTTDDEPMDSETTDDVGALS